VRREPVPIQLETACGATAWLRTAQKKKRLSIQIHPVSRATSDFPAVRILGKVERLLVGSNRKGYRIGRLERK
jgi:hypothetical protein